MTHVPDIRGIELPSLPVAPEEMATYLQQEVGRLTTLIHHVTNPEVIPSTEHMKLIHNLGSAAYHLSQAVEQVQNISDFSVQTRHPHSSMVLLPSPRRGEEVAEKTEAVINDVEIGTGPKPEVIEEAPEQEQLPESIVTELDNDLNSAEESSDNAETITDNDVSISKEDTNMPLDTSVSPDFTKDQSEVEAEEESLHKEMVSQISDRLKLRPRQRAMLDIVFKGITHGGWFKQADLDFSTIAFTSLSARNQAWSELSKLLIENGVFEKDGEKSRRKYRILELTSEESGETNSANENSEKMLDEAQPETLAEDTSIAVTASEVTQQTSIQVSAADVAYKALTSQVQSSREESPQRPESGVSQQFLIALAQKVAAYTESMGGENPKLPLVINHLMEDNKNVTKDEVRAWVNELINNGMYHLVPGDGTRYLIKGPDPNRKIEAPKAPIAETTTDPRTWTEVDVEIAYRIFGQLIQTENINVGMKLDTLFGEVRRGLQPKQIRQAMSKLQAEGYIITEELPAEERNHNKGKTPARHIVRIPQQAVWDQLHTDPHVVKEHLRTLIP